MKWLSSLFQMFGPKKCQRKARKRCARSKSILKNFIILKTGSSSITWMAVLWNTYYGNTDPGCCQAISGQKIAVTPVVQYDSIITFISHPHLSLFIVLRVCCLADWLINSWRRWQQAMFMYLSVKMVSWCE